MWYIHTTKGGPAIRRNEILNPVIIRVNLGNTELNKRSQSQKAVLCDSLFMRCSEYVNL